MDKNPISFLQEYLMKRQMVPNYSIIESRNGTHLNWFKIRVECGEKVFDGEASSKKVAKLNAAKGMIELMGLSPSNGFLPNINPPTVNPPNFNHVSTPQNSTTFNATSININYVGRLQEMAQKDGTGLPVYLDKASSGPAHQPKFTTICKFNNMEEEATASTKKESKTLAAKQMFERINPPNEHVCKSKQELASFLETIDKGISDLKIHKDNATAMAESADKALQRYIPLSKILVPKNSSLEEKRSYCDYHTFLRDAFSDKDREHVMDKLKDTMRACQKNNDAVNVMASLKLALKKLNINVKEVDVFERKETSIFGLQLDTDPVISEIGQGPNKSSAAIQSILQMAVTVSILIA